MLMTFELAGDQKKKKKNAQNDELVAAVEP